VSDFVDKDFAVKVSLRRAFRERGDAAKTVVNAEMQQMVDKQVWHGVHVSNLTLAERRAVIPCTLFLKNKFTASGAFDKYKAHRGWRTQIRACSRTSRPQQPRRDSGCRRTDRQDRQDH
jgi:hypothetical protein